MLRLSALSTLTLALLASCAHSATDTRTIVFVHGAFADHHAFDAVAPILTAQGYKIIAPDLPGHGADATPIAGIELETYVQAIEAVVRAEEEVVLVGHSMAGMVVSQVAEREPDRVSAVIFVAAYLPQDGQALQTLAEMDPDSLVGKNLELAADDSTASIRSEAVAEAICADVDPAIQQAIVSSQKPEPLKPFQGTVTLTSDNFGRVPKAYLRTGQDRAVTPALQAKMLAGYPELPTEELATSHLPFVAQPEAFVTTLLTLIERAR